jgi:hypothetical protein
MEDIQDDTREPGIRSKFVRDIPRDEVRGTNPHGPHLIAHLELPAALQEHAGLNLRVGV